MDIQITINSRVRQSPPSLLPAKNQFPLGVRARDAVLAFLQNSSRRVSHRINCKWRARREAKNFGGKSEVEERGSNAVDECSRRR